MRRELKVEGKAIGVAQLTECLPGTLQVLGSILGTAYQQVQWATLAILAFMTVAWRQEDQNFKVVLTCIVQGQPGLHDALSLEGKKEQNKQTQAETCLSG